MKKRGYNQAEILAKNMAKKLDISVYDALERVKDTKTQVGLKKEEREINIKGAFKIKNQKSPFGRIRTRKIKNFKVVFLVDDVVTSGATLKEATKVLKKAHSAGSGRAGELKVYGITLAHGQ